MANYNSKKDNDKGIVDISSGSQVRKVYNKKGRGVRVLCIVLSIIFLLGGSGLLYYYSILNSLEYESIVDVIDKGNDTQKATLPEMMGSDTQLSLGTDDLLSDSKVLNVMLFGEDNANGSDHGRSDTMIMMSIDNRNKKLKLTSFQRDTYVYIPGYGYNKLNASYTYGGAKLAIQTIEANFGIKVDRYAVVDFKSFIDIIDILGGIDLELTNDEITYINYQMYKNGQTDNPNLITDSAGVVHLKGQQALWHARNRGLSIGEDGNTIGIQGDDWDRTSRQRQLIETLFNDMKSASLPQIISIVGSVGPLVTTNLKKDEITTLVSHALKYLQYDVEQYYIPSRPELWYYDDYSEVGSVIKFTDLNQQRIEFAEFIYEDLITGGSQNAQ